MEEGDLAIDLHQEEVSTSPPSEVASTAVAVDGQYEIDHIVGHGPVLDKVTGKMAIMHKVSNFRLFLQFF